MEDTSFQVTLAVERNRIIYSLINSINRLIILQHVYLQYKQIHSQIAVQANTLQIVEYIFMLTSSYILSAYKFSVLKINSVLTLGVFQ